MTLTLFELGEPSNIARETLRADCDELQVRVEMDDILCKACEPFDYSFDGTSTFEMPKFNAPKKDGSWAIGLIVGPSGSGKTQLLKRHYDVTAEPTWNVNKAIVSHFASHEDAMDRLSATGLNSVPSWCRPYHVLSNGEQFRARVARMIDSDTSFDEYTSVIDRTVAKACSHALQRHIRKNNLKHVVFSTCHYDVIEWLQPDWVFDTATATMLPRGSLQRRSPLLVTVDPCHRSWWRLFAHHHYLSRDINPASECYFARIEQTPIAFCSVIPLPHAKMHNSYICNRLVVLPDYQGFGIGIRLLEWLGELMIKKKRRMFSVTVHDRLGRYRDKSPKWRPTSSNHKTTARPISLTGIRGFSKTQRQGFRYSHEYIGATSHGSK